MVPKYNSPSKYFATRRFLYPCGFFLISSSLNVSVVAFAALCLGDATLGDVVLVFCIFFCFCFLGVVFFPLSSPSLLSAAAFLDDTFEAVVVFAGFFAALEGLATFGLAYLLSLVFCFFFSFNAIFSLVAGFLFCGSTAFSWGDESEGRTAGTDIFVGLLVFLLSEALFPESIVFVFFCVGPSLDDWREEESFAWFLLLLPSPALSRPFVCSICACGDFPLVFPGDVVFPVSLVTFSFLSFFLT